MKPLILIVTRNCNLRCSYCDVDKKNIFMTKKVAQKATLLYFDWAKNNHQKKIWIRFFGGEPLMNFNVVQYVVEYANDLFKKENIEILFDLTTNGLLLDDGKIEFFKSNNNINFIVSLDGDEGTQNLNRNIKKIKIDSYGNIYRHHKELANLPNLIINMVAAPNQVEFFYDNFIHNYNLGFRKFNFLPAYFLKWNNEELRILIDEFNKLLFFLRRHREVFVKNAEVFSMIPFFNSGFVIDCNGDLFGENLILSKYFLHLNNKLIKGNILKENSGDLLNFNENGDIVSLIKGIVGGDIFYSSLKVDRILTNFIRKLLISDKNYENKKN